MSSASYQQANCRVADVVDLRAVLALCLDEPICMPELPTAHDDPYAVSRRTVQKAWKRACEKRARFPGYRPGNRCFDLTTIDLHSRTAATPTASRIAIVRDMLAGWSCAVQKGQTTKQLVEWVPTYLTNDKYVRRWRGVGHLEEAAQWIGQTCGTPATRSAGR